MKRSKDSDPLMGTLPFRGRQHSSSRPHVTGAVCKAFTGRLLNSNDCEPSWTDHQSMGCSLRLDRLNTVRCAVMEGWSMKAVWERKQIFPIRLTLVVVATESRYKYQLFSLMHIRAAGRMAKELEERLGCFTGRTVRLTTGQREG